MYDRACEGCGWQAIDVVEPVYVGVVRCPTCDAPTVRAWLTKPASVIGDAMDHLQVNGAKTPIHFTSKQERRRWMKQHHLVDATRHVGEDGGDKSRHTSRWEAMDAYTLENARILVTRASQEPARNDPPPAPLHVTTTYGDVRFTGGKRELIPHGR